MNCRICGKFFWVRPYRRDEAKCCSRKCWVRYLHRLNDKGIEITCIVCGKQKHIFPAHINQTRQGPPRYCSQRCLGIDRLGPKNVMFGKTGEMNPSWNGGTSFLPYAREFNKRLREEIRARDHHVCQHCGATDNGGKKMCVHHIDYNKNNNLPANLIALCDDCHLRTNGNRETWRVLFREKTAEVYLA